MSSIEKTEANDGGIEKRVLDEPLFKKQSMSMVMAIVAALAVIAVGSISIMKYSGGTQPVVFSVILKKREVQRITVLPFPFQSFKNVSSWLRSAIESSYSFDFLNYDKQVEGARYYFTKDGYSSYLKALDAKGVRADLISKKIEAAAIPLSDPVFINGGVAAGQFFWRYRVPILLSYYGGKTPVFQKETVEVLVFRVPTNESVNGLAIEEFNMQ